MNFPKVSLTEPSDLGTLIPNYDNIAGALTADSKIPRDWPYGIDINGMLILDFDAKKILASFELIMQKHLWVLDPSLNLPYTNVDANLHVKDETL